MPEGPTIAILAEEVKSFAGKKVTAVAGNTKTVDITLLKNRTITAIKSWGKHFLICFDGFTVRIHFLMFGSFSINERREGREPRLRLAFKNGEMSFYTCSVQLLDGDINDFYDWSSDVMNPAWNANEAKRKVLKRSDDMVCDVLMDQHIFAGVGNIIKNEVFYRIKINPLLKVKELPAKKINEMVKEAVDYSFDFMMWKMLFILKKQWIVYAKKYCQACGTKTTLAYPGKLKRRTFYCTHCQHEYVNKKITKEN